MKKKRDGEWREFVLGIPASASDQVFRFPPDLDVLEVEFPKEGIYRYELYTVDAVWTLKVTTGAAWLGTTGWILARVLEK